MVIPAELAPFFLVGLWLVVLPQSVVRFYAWLHKGTLRPSALPSIWVVRLTGLIWLVGLVAAAAMPQRLP